MPNKRGESKVSSYVTGSIKSVEKSLPESANMFKGHSLLTFKKFLIQTLRGKFDDLPFPRLMESNSVIVARYRKVSLVEWCEEECFAESGINADSLNLLQDVAKHNNFKDLATYALTCLNTCEQCNCLENIFLSHSYQNQAL